MAQEPQPKANPAFLRHSVRRLDQWGPTLSTLEKIAQAFKIDLIDFFKKDAPLTVDSFDKTLVDRIKIIDELEPEQKSHIYAIIDMAVANNRLKKTLTNALDTNF